VPDYSSGEDLLAEFTDTAVTFTEETATTVDASLSSSDPPIVRLVDLMIDEAIQDGAIRIELRLIEGSVIVVYHFPDGRFRNRDNPPARLLRPLLQRLMEVFTEKDSFHHKSGATLTCRVDSDNLGAVVHISTA
jgi:type II secretory ATPase GspE/PulE/Tfp pilus assembly ATPase PilB-like protein